jgi:serine/threonine protein kinase
VAEEAQKIRSADRSFPAPVSWLEESGQAWEASGLAARLLDLPSCDRSARLPLLIEMVRIDLRHQWQQGRQVGVESYLEAIPELGTSETIPAELILAEFEARRRSGAPAELAEFERRFPHQAEALRQMIGGSQATATESVLGGFGEMTTRPRQVPLSVVRARKSPVKLPKQFGRYRIIKRLGQGAMGSVYLAHDTQLDRRMALKVPHFRAGDNSPTADRDDLDRFYREARVAATLNHPNLCPVYDVGQIDGIHYLSMEYIQGRPLSDSIDPERPMPPRRAAVVVRKLALALEVAHSRGIVHRDLKPANIMINARRGPVIMDFGLAWRIGSNDERLTKTGMILGTPAYMSPEQVSGNSEFLGPSCDIYSLGIILYQMLTACLPFVGPDAVVLGQILYVEPTPPSAHSPDLDPQIEAICLKAMAKRPEDRYATMGDLAAALGDYLRGGDLPPRLSSANGAPEVPDEVGTVVMEIGGPDPAVRSTGPMRPPEGESDPARPIEWSGRADELAMLQKSWHQWTTIVELFALHRSRGHVDWHAYQELHKELIEACRARSAAVVEAKRAFYRELEDLALPWLTPKALAQTDREILFSLLLRCQQAEQELDRHASELQGPDDLPSAWTTWGRASAVFLVVTVVFGLSVSIWMASAVFLVVTVVFGF